MKRLKLATTLLAAALLASPAAYAASNLKIGFLTTLSGPGAVIGLEMKDGFNLGIKHSGN
jgi:branched-chain amino acid transport system substrate-binding protein